jgi:hypothetical protein
VFNAFRRPLLSVIAPAACTLAVSCSKSTSHLDGDVQQAATPISAGAECTRAWLRPSAIPPDHGMWTDKDAADSTRVVAMIGPPDVRAGSTALTRTIETIEGAGRTQPVHSRADAAEMHLELLPRYAVDERAEATSRTSVDRTTEPAAAYTISTLISLASYEACAGPSPFAVRYVRRDASGRVVHDAMLHRIPDSR